MCKNMYTAAMNSSFLSVYAVGEAGKCLSKHLPIGVAMAFHVVCVEEIMVSTLPLYAGVSGFLLRSILNSGSSDL